jgi:hypothetical protein
MSGARLHPIAPQIRGSGDWIPGAKYNVGRTPDGQQWIFCWSAGRLYFHRFSADGEYLGRQSRITTTYEEQLAWIAELGLVPATIHVHDFSSHGHPGVGLLEPTLAIDEHPSHFDDGDYETPEAQEATFRWWRERGAFVLFWDTTEYWIDGQGEEFY